MDAFIVYTIKELLYVYAILSSLKAEGSEYPRYRDLVLHIYLVYSNFN